MKDYAKQAQKRYSKKCKHVSLRLNMENSQHKTAWDILSDVKNKQEYIVQAVMLASLLPVTTDEEVNGNDYPF